MVSRVDLARPGDELVVDVGGHAHPLSWLGFPSERGGCGRRDSNPHRRRGTPASSPFGRRPHGCDGRPGGTLTLVSRSAATRLNPRPPGVALPGRGSNPRLPGNNRTSSRSTTWHGRLRSAVPLSEHSFASSRPGMVDSAPLSRSPSTASLRLVLAWSTPLRCPALRAQLRFVSSWHGRLRSAVPLSQHSFASSRPGNGVLPDSMGTATGTRTPLSGLRARCLHLSTIAACGGSGATRTPKGLATPTCFRDRLLIQPDRFHERKGWDSHPHGLSTRTRVANGLLIWPDPFLGALGGSRTHDLVRTRDVLSLLSYEGRAQAQPRRHDSNVRPPPSEGGALLR